MTFRRKPAPRHPDILNLAKTNAHLIALADFVETDCYLGNIQKTAEVGDFAFPPQMGHMPF
jgi:hypothetical protein